MMQDIHHTAQWGEGERWGQNPTEIGMARLALSDADKLVRDWFIETTEALGCRVHFDAMGNIFAIRPGRRQGPPTAMGSHLDTQPAGGRYDGILGVLAGVAVLRAVHEASMETGYQTEYPLCVVNWTNEEGARFPQCMMASAVWAGVTSVDTAHAVASVSLDDDGVTVGSELARIGYRGKTAAHHTATPLAAHFELHIEQGPILEAAGQRIGAVQGVQAMRWFTITVTGRDAHTGATNLENRADAMLAAAKMIVRSHQVATQLQGLASTGLLTVHPGSTNTVPGVVTFSLDLRADADPKMDAMEAALRADFAAIAAGSDAYTDSCTSGRPCAVSWQQTAGAPVARFDDDCLRCIHEGAEDLFGATQAAALTRRMYSGAGHDSVHTSTRVPTAMIFVPCRDGVTHNPTEYTSPEDCGNGAQVLLNAVLRYDAARKA